jgi:HTH-type transcriptional regulator / antitoxin HigA
MLRNNSAVHPPGFFINEELQARGWSQTDLAFITEQSEVQINHILKGRKVIDANLAVVLGDAFGVDPDFFIKLENKYQLSNAKPAPTGVKKKAQWQSVYPVREMLKRGWIEEDDASLLDAQMLRFFEKPSIDQIPYMGGSIEGVSFAARKTNPSEIPSAEELAWLYRVRQIAKKMDANTYDPDIMDECVEKLRNLLASRDDVSYVPSILRDYGIRFVIVENLPKAKIDGVCTWLGDEPVIGITNRFDRLDNFWFVLRHELEHVIQGHGKDDGFSKLDCLENENRATDESVDKEERIANQSAAEFGVPRSQLNSFVARKSPYFSEKDVLGFASRLEVHPAIVIGQLQFVLRKWNFLRKYLSSSVSGVREIFISEFENGGSISLDGWGHKVKTQL